MRVVARLIEADGVGPNGESWTRDALRQLAEKVQGVKVRQRIGSRVPLDARGTDQDTDPIIGEVGSGALIGDEVIVTMNLDDAVTHGHVVGLSGVATHEDGVMVSVERVDSIGLDDDPQSCSWGEVIG